ncbi:(Fe-S)-binding protein [Clostridia bacterium]|nr:(Fe-S)-binding protein [Clostridia bacterium]
MKNMKLSDKSMNLIIQEEEKCIGCKKCMEGCPMLDTFSDSPKTLLGQLKSTGTFSPSLPYSCMLCGYCTEVCPTSVDLKSLFLELRRNTVDNYDGKLPKEFNLRGVELHQKLSFSSLFTDDIRNLQSDTILFPGCALLSHSPETVQNTYNYLREKIDGIGIYTKCCGKPTSYMGKKEEFDSYYGILAKEFQTKGIKRIITCCPNCYITIKNNSPGIEVISLWEVIADLGIPEDKVGRFRNLDKEFTIHDPCPIRKEENMHYSVRKIMEDLGLTVEEMQHSKGKTLCCGAGGMVSITHDEIAKAHTNRRAQEANTEYIITYCQECVESMKKGGKTSYHILDLLFNDNYDNMKKTNQTLLLRWVNRFKGKSIGK